MSNSGRTVLGGLAGLMMLGADAPAFAQVLEIGSGGAVIVHDRPEITRSTGSTPIVQPVSPRSRPHRRLQGSATPNLTPLNSAAGRAELSPDLVEAVAWRESHLRQSAYSSKGAIGEMQLMPATARSLGVDPYDQDQNLRGGAQYLQALLHRYDGDVVRALAAYNAGPGAVDRYRGTPPFRETQAYVASILEHMSEHVAGPARTSKR